MRNADLDVFRALIRTQNGLAAPPVRAVPKPRAGSLTPAASPAAPLSPDVQITPEDDGAQVIAPFPKEDPLVVQGGRERVVERPADEQAAGEGTLDDVLQRLEEILSEMRGLTAPELEPPRRDICESAMA